jgi:hypothetical protein
VVSRARWRDIWQRARGRSFRCQRQLHQAQAGRVLDAICDGGGGGHDGRLSDATRPERAGRGRHFNQERLDIGQIRRRQLAVVEQARIGHLPQVVVEQSLAQGKPETLHGAALHLTLNTKRINGPADILGDHEAVQRDQSSVGVVSSRAS